MIDNRDDYFDLVRVNALPVTPEGLREFATIMRESCAYDSNNMFHLSYQWNDKNHRHVEDMKIKICEAADRIEKLEEALCEIACDCSDACYYDHVIAHCPHKQARTALEGKKDG